MNTESLNSLLYGSKLKAYALMRRTTYVLSILSVGILLYIHGVVEDHATLQILYYAIDGVLAVFVVMYLFRILYAFERIRFLERTWLEGLLLLAFCINAFSTYVLGVPVIYHIFDRLGLSLSVEVYRAGVSLYLLLLLVIELLETKLHLKTIQLRPSLTFLLSFIVLITIGTGLFMLPKMTTTPHGMRFIDALFMATSASCITGLVVVDPGTYLTLSGQVLLLLLVQLGGLGVLTFATFFASLMREGMGVKQHVAMRELMDSDSLLSTKGLLGKLITLTLSIEAIGAVIIFASWSPEVHFTGLGSKIFYSIFHAVAGFCNAGFSLFPEGLYTQPIRTGYNLHLAIAALVILGGLGFPTMLDVFSPASMRRRMSAPWRNWKLLSRVTIYTSAGLLALGTGMFFLLEYYNTLASLNFAEAIVASFFQSATTRSAGFHTVDMSALNTPTILLFLFLMFIGASPGSLGGGIKTTTFAVIILAVISTIRGRENLEMGRRTIPHSVAYKAFSVFTFAVVINLFCIFILSITDARFPILDLMFEQVSAFATVGLSTGITAGLSDMGKLVISCSMYLGRVGTLTLALALSSRVTSKAYKYPTSHLPVG